MKPAKLGKKGAKFTKCTDVYTALEDIPQVLLF